MYPFVYPLEEFRLTRYPKQGKGRKWTVAELKAIPSTWKDDSLSDGDGLVGEVRITSDGSATVRFKYGFRWGAGKKWFQTGTWPANSLEDIRTRRDEARALVREGVNPNDRKQADKIEAQQQVEAVIVAAAEVRQSELTVKDMFDSWIEDGVKRIDGNAEIRRAFDKDVLPRVGKIAVRHVSESDLRDVLKAMVARGVNRMAVQVSNDIKQMFDWAEKRRPWRALMIDGDPAALIEIKKIVSPDYDMNDERERVLSPAEIRELRDTLATMEAAYEAAPAGKKYSTPRGLQKTSQLAVWICLGTLCRIGELLKAEWSHVDFEARTWFIPKENAKGAKGKKQDQLVSLSDFALRQFTALGTLTGDSNWLFPARLVTGPINVKTVTKQVGDRQEKFKDRAAPLKNRKSDNSLVLGGGKNGDWTPHDMRRTGATMMQSLGVSLDVIDRCQNHLIAGSKVRRAYMHHDYLDEKREAWSRLGAKLDEILL